MGSSNTTNPTPAVIPTHTDELAVEGHDESCFNEDCKNAPCAGSGAPMNATGNTTCAECGTVFDATATVS